MRAQLLALLAAGVILGCRDGSVPTAWTPDVPPNVSATARTESFFVSATATLFNPCTGEAVDFQFRFHVKVHETVDANGVVHFALEANDAGSTGVGQVSGARYRQTGATVTIENPGSASTLTVIDNFVRPSQGGLGTLVITFVFHITENANGDLTADVTVTDAKCVG